MPSVPRALLCALLLAMPAFAQTTKKAPPPAPPPAAAKPADPYAGEAVVVERLDTAYDFHADGTGTKLDTDVARMQSDVAVRNFGVVSIPYASGTQKLEIVYLRVRKPDGTVVSTPASDAQDQPAPVTQAAPFYSDLHLLQIPARGLAVGDRIEYQVRTLLNVPEAKDHFWGVESFGTGVVVLERAVELRVPTGKYVQVSSPKFPAKMTTEGAETVYRWTGAQLKPTPKPKADGTAAADDPAASEDKLPPIAWTTFHSWAEVGEWYRGLALDRAAATPSIKSRADGEIAAATTPDARIQALYAYVSTHVRYIGVAFGIGRYQPHPAGEVLANQYGDCKDKHTLLAAMLRAEDLPASAVLIGEGVELDEAVPSPGAFNHLITLTSDAEHNEIWLDSTPEVAPYRMLSSTLRDKLALVIPATGEPTLRRTPADPPFPAFTRFEGAGTLTADGTFKGHVDLTMRGDQELAFRQVLQNVTPGQWDRVTQFYARASGFSGDPSNTTADPPGKTAAPLHVGYDYTRTPYGDWDNFRVVPLQPALLLPLSDQKAAPTMPIDLGSKHSETAVSRIALPAGYGAELPPAVHVHTEFATLDKTYRLEEAGGKNTLVTERTLAILVPKLPVAQWPAYRKFLDDVGETEPWVQLTTAANSGLTGRHPPVPGENNPVAEELVRQADQAEGRQDFTTAVQKLDQAKAINENQAFLWSNYGVAAGWAGRTHEAEEDYRRELKAHPEEAHVSLLLVYALHNQGKDAEAKALLAAVAAANTANEVVVRESAGAYAVLNDEPDAEKVLRAGLAAAPNDLMLKLTLGDNLLRQGKRQEADAQLAAVVNSSKDPDQLNNTAYLLADASLDLPVAEQAARHALGLVNAATRTGETGITSNAALRRSMLLLACWDTFGWTLYQEGHLDEAEPWLRAAWTDGYGAEPGLHYGLLLEKRGRVADAARVLHLAAEGERGSNGAAVAKFIAEHEAADVAATKVTLPDGKMELQRQRTFSVARGTNKVEGWAVFEMEYANGHPPLPRLAHGEEGLTDLRPALTEADLHTSLPPATDGHLLRRGILSCHTGPTCSFVWLTPMAALTQ